ncbi:MAG: hypothetical protein PHV74_07030 [Dehalococcoidia bacterium]|nr:hypothetical protein [Dehalococcoidia bacterium]
MTLPQWATPERQAYLVDLFRECGGFCVYGHKPCKNPDHHFQNHIEEFIKGWKEDDRAERADLLRLEHELIHQNPDTKGWGRRFDPVTREQFLDSRPSYYLEGIGISGLTFRRIAKIRIPSAYTRLYVELPKGKLSRNKKRKLKRQQIQTETEMIDCLCQMAVDDYWQHI